MGSEMCIRDRYDLYVFKHPEELEEYLMDIIREICDQEQNSLKNGGNAIIRDILHYVEQNYQYDLSLQELAEKKYFMNSSYLSRLFKKTINLSLIEYINGVRIKAAQNMIEKTNESISSVAEKTGFMTSAHFRRVFKDATGLSPQQYRQYFKRVNKPEK